MNITIVCGHYLPDMGYIEVHLARALIISGHKITVVTSSAVPQYVASLQKKLLPGFANDGAIAIIRLKPAFALGQIVISSGLNKHVSASKPELILVIGLGKRFPKPVFDVNCRILTLLGDNDYSYAKGSTLNRLKSKLLFRFLKKSTYEKAVLKSAAIVAYTPESFEAAAALMSEKYKKSLLAQNHFISLGFWPDEFHIISSQRDPLRTSMGFDPNQIVLITATRVVPEKRLEKVFDLINQLPINYVWLVVGGNNSPYCQEFETAAGKAFGERFRMLSFRDRSNLNGLYNMADIALYTTPAISIFEALGTGLPCMLPDKKSLSHILVSAFNGFYYDEPSNPEIAAQIQKLDLSTNMRFERSAHAKQQFSWIGIAEKLVKF